MNLISFYILFVFFNWHVLFKSTCTMVVGTFLFRSCTAEVRCLTLNVWFFFSLILHMWKEQLFLLCYVISSDRAACVPPLAGVTVPPRADVPRPRSLRSGAEEPR